MAIEWRYEDERLIFGGPDNGGEVYSDSGLWYGTATYNGDVSGVGPCDTVEEAKSFTLVAYRRLTDG